MALIVPNVGKLFELENIIAASSFDIHLFKASISPDRDTVLADLLAVEADFSGYAFQTVATFSAAAIDPAHYAMSLGNLLVFENSTGVVGNSIYGAWADDGAGNLIAVDEFDAGPQDMLIAGDVLPIKLRLLLGSINSN